MSNLNPEDLWKMPPEDFNKWRRENDLKRLFYVFYKTLPHFEDWLEKNNLTVDFILETDNPGQFFYWDKVTYCFKTTKQNQEEKYISYFFVPVYDRFHEKDLLKNHQIYREQESEIHEFFRYTPYFLWVKKEHNVANPIKSRYSSDMDTFRYITGQAPDVPDMCQWTIAPGFTVLKMGGTKIDGWYKVNGRNLDFTNLDFLEIEGDFSWSSIINIFYSHCANITFNKAVANFTKFYRCEFRKLNVINTRFQGISFYKCNFFSTSFDNSSISNMELEDCSVNNISFYRVEVDGIYYIPPKKEVQHGVVMTYGYAAANFKRFRVLYQSNGLRQEASDAYYYERFYEMRNNWGLQKLSFAFKLLRTTDIGYAFSYFKHHFGRLVKSFTDFLSYIIWGYGERPGRIISTTFLILILYTVIYFFSDIDKLKGDLVNSSYLSIVTFTTLGFGDITPLSSNNYKLIVGSEALLGAFLMGLLVAGYANKSKY